MVTLVMQQDGHYYRHEADDEDADGTPETPLSDAATAIVMNCEPSTSRMGLAGLAGMAGLGGQGLSLEDVHPGMAGLAGSLQSLAGAVPGPGPPLGTLGPMGPLGPLGPHGSSSLQRHAGKRVLFVSGHPVPALGHQRPDQLDAGEVVEDALEDDWAAAHAAAQWSTPLVAARSQVSPLLPLPSLAQLLRPSAAITLFCPPYHRGRGTSPLPAASSAPRAPRAPPTCLPRPTRPGHDALAAMRVPPLHV